MQPRAKSVHCGQKTDTTFRSVKGEGRWGVLFSLKLFSLRALWQVIVANSCHSSFILDRAGLLNCIFIYERHEFVLALLVTEGHLERKPKGTKELNSDQTYMEASDSYI